MASEESGYKYDDDDDGELAYYTELAVHETERWIQTVTRQRFRYPDDGRRSLADGTMLCQLLNCIKPGAISRINYMNTPLAGKDNLSVFLVTCRDGFGLNEGQLFNVDDLDEVTGDFDSDDGDEQYELECDRKLRNVVLTIFWLAKSIHSWYDGPQLDFSSFTELLSHPATRNIHKSSTTNDTHTTTAASAGSTHRQQLPHHSENTNNHNRTQSRDSTQSGDWSSPSEASSYREGDSAAAAGAGGASATDEYSSTVTQPDNTNTMSSSYPAIVTAEDAVGGVEDDMRYSATFDAVYDSGANDSTCTYDSNADNRRDSSRYSSSDALSVKSDDTSNHSQKGPVILGNRAGLGVPKASQPAVNPLQFVSNQAKSRKMAEEAEATINKMAEQKQAKKQSNQDEDIDWQSHDDNRQTMFYENLSSWKMKLRQKSRVDDRLASLDEPEPEPQQNSKPKTFSEMRSGRQNLNFYPYGDDTVTAQSSSPDKASRSSRHMSASDAVTSTYTDNNGRDNSQRTGPSANGEPQDARQQQHAGLTRSRSQPAPAEVEVEHVSEEDKTGLRQEEISALKQQSRVTALHKSFSTGVHSDDDNEEAVTTQLNKKIIRIIRPPGHERGFGFSLRGGGKRGEPLVVDFVTAKSPADVCELQRGDVVREINGVSVRSHDRQSVMHLIAEASQSGQLDLVVHREKAETHSTDDELESEMIVHEDIVANDHTRAHTQPASTATQYNHGTSQFDRNNDDQQGHAEEQDSDGDEPPPLPSSLPPPLPTSLPPDVEPSSETNDSSTKPADTNDTGGGAPPRWARDRQDSVERIKTDIVKKRSEFFGLNVDESDEYHMIKAEREQRKEEEKLWHKIEEKNHSLSPRQNLLDDIRSKRQLKTNSSPPRSALNISSKFELAEKEQEIIDNLEKAQAIKDKERETMQDPLRSWKSMGHLRRSHDPDMDHDAVSHTTDYQAAFSDISRPLYATVGGSRTRGASVGSGAGDSVGYGMRGAKSCVDLDAERARMREWDEQQQRKRQPADHDDQYTVHTEVTLSPQEKFRKDKSLIQTQYQEDLKKSAKHGEEYKKQEVELLKDELQHQKDLMHQRQANRKMLQEEAKKAKRPQSTSDYPWKTKTADEIKWEEEQARVLAESQVERQKQVEEKLEAEKKILKLREERNQRHLEEDQQHNLENRRKYMEENERFMAEQEQRRKQLEMENEREREIQRQEQQRQEALLQERKRALAEQREQQQREQQRLEEEKIKLEKQRERLKIEEEEKRKELERQRQAAEQERLEELERDRFEQLVKLQREGEEQRKRDARRAREAEQQAKQQLIHDNEQLLEERIRNDAERLKHEKAQIYSQESPSTSVNHLFNRDYDTQNNSENRKEAKEPSYHIVLADPQYHQQPVVSDGYHTGNQSRPARQATYKSEPDLSTMSAPQPAATRQQGTSDDERRTRNPPATTKASKTSDAVAWLGAMAGAWTDPDVKASQQPDNESRAQRSVSPQVIHGDSNSANDNRSNHHRLYSDGSNVQPRPHNSVSNEHNRTRSNDNYQDRNYYDNRQDNRHNAAPRYEQTQANNRQPQQQQPMTTQDESRDRYDDGARHNGGGSGPRHRIERRADRLQQYHTHVTPQADYRMSQDIPLQRQPDHLSSHQRWGSTPQLYNQPLSHAQQPHTQSTAQLHQRHAEPQRNVQVRTMQPNASQWVPGSAQQQPQQTYRQTSTDTQHHAHRQTSHHRQQSVPLSPDDVRYGAYKAREEALALDKKSWRLDSQSNQDEDYTMYQTDRPAYSPMSKESLHNIGAAPRKTLINNNQWINNNATTTATRQQQQQQQHDSRTTTQSMGGDDNRQRDWMGSSQSLGGTHIMEHVQQPVQHHAKRSRPIPESIKQTLVHRVNAPPPPSHYVRENDLNMHNAHITATYNNDPYAQQHNRYPDIIPSDDPYRQPQYPPRGSSNPDDYDPYKYPQHPHPHPSNPPPAPSSGSMYNPVAPAKPPRLGEDAPVSAQHIPAVTGRFVCTQCERPIGHGAAMFISSLQLYYHIQCFYCSVCQTRLTPTDPTYNYTDVCVRAAKLHCHGCFSSDRDGLKFSHV